MLERRSVVILNDTALPPGLSGGELGRFVERGGGLLIAVGSHTSWPSNDTTIFPGKLGNIVDRSGGRGATLGFRDYSHPVFEIFKAPRSGDFSSARVREYRAIEKGPDDLVLARYDDGAVAVAERRIGTGRVIALTTTLDDSWTDLPKRPVYLPLVHSMVKYLAHYEQSAPWRTVGDVVDLAAKSRADRSIVTPSNDRRVMRTNDPGALELTEQGIYEVRATAAGSGRPERIAVNVDPAESDLAELDPQELVAFVTGRATQQSANAAQPQGPQELTPQEAEKRQGLWWYLLLAGLVLLATEMVVANYLSQRERFL
jgi:hypothetical protein